MTTRRLNSEQTWSRKQLQQTIQNNNSRTQLKNTKDNHHGIIINAGGYTHTSVAILDALLAVKKPTIELHITNIYKREDFRHKSLISKAADGIICGLGADGYIMALDGIKKIIDNEN